LRLPGGVQGLPVVALLAEVPRYNPFGQFLRYFEPMTPLRRKQMGGQDGKRVVLIGRP